MSSGRQLRWRVKGSPLGTLQDDGLNARDEYKDGYTFGFDGSFIDCGDYVYVPTFERNEGLKQIDYFTGWHPVRDQPIALMVDHSYNIASEMCHVRMGFIAFSVRAIQRKFRRRRSDRCGS